MRDFAHMPASLSRTGLHPLDQCVVAQDLRRFRVVDELCLPDPRQSGGVDEFRPESPLGCRRIAVLLVDVLHQSQRDGLGHTPSPSAMDLNGWRQPFGGGRDPPSTVKR